MIKNLTTKTVTNASASVGGGVIGAMLSNVLLDFIPKEYHDKKYIGRALLVALSVAGVAAFKGKDTMALFLKGGLTGMAILQLKYLISYALEQTGMLQENETVKSALGVSANCGCGSKQLNAPERYSDAHLAMQNLGVEQSESYISPNDFN